MVDGNPGTTLTDAALEWEGGWTPDSLEWPTPTASLPNDAESAESWLARKVAHATKENATRAGVPLGIAVKIANIGGGLPDRQTATGGGDTSKRGPVLNPRFVEALMGLPDGWSVCELLETQ